MKNNNVKQKMFISTLIIVILILIMELLLIKTGNIKNNKQIIKEMTEGEYESKLTELNKSHEDYALQVESNKQKIATAITNQKVATSQNDTIDVMVTNIAKILQVGTSDATATAEDIAIDKTAYVNGKLVSGTLVTSSPGYSIHVNASGSNGNNIYYCSDLNNMTINGTYGEAGNSSSYLKIYGITGENTTTLYSLLAPTGTNKNNILEEIDISIYDAIQITTNYCTFRGDLSFN